MGWSCLSGGRSFDRRRTGSKFTGTLLASTEFPVGDAGANPQANSPVLAEDVAAGRPRRHPQTITALRPGLVRRVAEPGEERRSLFIFVFRGARAGRGFWRRHADGDVRGAGAARRAAELRAVGHGLRVLGGVLSSRCRRIFSRRNVERRDREEQRASMASSVDAWRERGDESRRDGTHTRLLGDTQGQRHGKNAGASPASP